MEIDVEEARGHQLIRNDFLLPELPRRRQKIHRIQQCTNNVEFGDCATITYHKLFVYNEDGHIFPPW